MSANNTNKQNVRVATKMERHRVKAVVFSAFLVVLMLSIAITFTAISLNSPGGRQPGENDDPPVGGGPLVFATPVNASYTLLKEFSGTELQFNDAINRWEAHMATTIGAAAGSPVVATFAGTVTSVRNDLKFGTTVVIQHQDGVQTTLSGLATDVSVRTGDRVEKGQRVGTVGTTSNVFRNEPHVRVEVTKNGNLVDPAEFISFTK